MRWIRRGWRRLQSLIRVNRLERGLDDEIRFHLEQQIETTSPLDPTIYVRVSLGLISIAALASYVPARAAALIDPVRTIRGD